MDISAFDHSFFQIALIAVVSLVPILLWFSFFHRKYKQRFRHVFLSFSAGMMSVIPIKLYEKYWDQALLFFENINLFEYISSLTNTPSLAKLFAFVSLSGIVALGLFVFTAFLMFFLEVLSGDNTIKAYRHKVGKILESPLLFVSIGLISGILAYGLSLSVHERIWFFVIVGMLEEYIKYLVLRFTNEESIHRIRDAIGYAIVVALGFAYVENILYFKNFITQSSLMSVQFWLLFGLRSTISVTAHVCFSAILAYFYGIAFFSKEMYQYELDHHHGGCVSWCHKLLHLKGSVLFHEQKMMEGMLLAMFLHAVFNSFLEFNRIAFMLMLLVGMFLTVLFMYKKARFLTETRICPYNKKACLLPQNLLGNQN